MTTVQRITIDHRVANQVQLPSGVIVRWKQSGAPSDPFVSQILSLYRARYFFAL